MKTSYKVLILALIILFGTTAAYDIALKRAYEKGDYNKPFADYDNLDFKDFDRIEIVAANLVNTKIMQSDKFNVRRIKWPENVQIVQKGSALIITATANTNKYFRASPADVIIECPSLKEIKTNATFVLNGKVMTAKDHDFAKFHGGATFITGFKQDSLSVVMDNFSSVFLKENSLNYLNARLGSSDSSRSTIDIDNSNQILSADLNLQHRSLMVLTNIYIKNLKYKLSDSAQVNLSGISLQLLSKK